MKYQELKKLKKGACIKDSKNQKYTFIKLEESIDHGKCFTIDEAISKISEGKGKRVVTIIAKDEEGKIKRLTPRQVSKSRRTITTDPEKIRKRYNDIMLNLAREHLCIGKEYDMYDAQSERDKVNNWNLRDMVAECDYHLSTYYEDGHVNYDLKAEDPATWKYETKLLRSFINDYKNKINDLVCFEGHCSNYD